MKSTVQNTLRWLATTFFAGLSSCVLVVGGYSIFVAGGHDWASAIVAAFVNLPLAVLALIVAVIIYRRQYHQLVVAAAFIAALALFFSATSVPELLGVRSYLYRTFEHPITTPADGWPLLLAGGFQVFFTFIFPFWLSQRFFRLILRIAARLLYGATPTPQSA
jgi:hypothetical protein